MLLVVVLLYWACSWFFENACLELEMYSAFYLRFEVFCRNMLISVQLYFEQKHFASVVLLWFET